ncbi:MAG: ABC transporter ATP-binding protein [Gemmatimonadetes bacterium]|nr:ABC transporter ATP-binding protein [Gemmatimonadota bacterium]
MTTAILARGLVRDFKTVRALDHVDLEVPAGIVFGFLGPNGAGKTTLIRVLLGLVTPNAGETRVFGVDPTRDGAAVRARTGALLEHHGLYERLTAEQNLAFHARAWRIPRPEAVARIAELLRGLGLWERRGERVGTWSRGMKQKLAVARAVLHRPPLVFLDEPTAGLDPVASATLRDDIERLARDEGVTVFLTTHNLQEAERLCASVGVIRRGTLLAVGSPADLRAQRSTSVVRVQARSWPPEVRAALGTHPAVRAVADDAGTLRLTLHHPDATPELVRWLVGHGLDLEAVTPERASFEQAFLDLVRDADGARAP